MIRTAFSCLCSFCAVIRFCCLLLAAATSLLTISSACLPSHSLLPTVSACTTCSYSLAPINSQPAAEAAALNQLNPPNLTTLHARRTNRYSNHHQTISTTPASRLHYPITTPYRYLQRHNTTHQRGSSSASRQTNQPSQRQLRPQHPSTSSMQRSHVSLHSINLSLSFVLFSSVQ